MRIGALELHTLDRLARISSYGLFLVYAVLLAGCGYQFQGSGSILPEDIKTIAILQAENKTTEPGVSLKFTEALRSRFERYGVVKVIDSPAAADAVLKTVVKEVGSRVRNTTGASERQTDVELDLELALTVFGELKRRSGQVLWRNDGIRVYQSFAGVSGVIVTRSAGFAGSDLSSQQLGTLSNREVSRGQKDAALNDALEESARLIYNEAVAEDF